jgi:hypothetical protein
MSNYKSQFQLSHAAYTVLPMIGRTIPETYLHLH